MADILPQLAHLKKPIVDNYPKNWYNLPNN
jgi:hypothetical protein